ncbi:MAG: hypothetical protein ACLR4X_00765 [Clostridia bacterium]
MKLIDNATKIRIPKDSIIAMTGLQGGGKTFFTNKYFEKENIICNDELFWNEFRKSGKKEMRSEKDYDDICIRTNELLYQMLRKYSKERPYTVLDSAPYYFKQRVTCLNELRKYFKNVILVLILPDFDTTWKQLQQRECSVKKMKEELGLTAPDYETMKFNEKILNLQIENKSIAVGADVTYIVRNQEKISIDTM